MSTCSQIYLTVISITIMIGVEYQGSFSPERTCDW